MSSPARPLIVAANRGPVTFERSDDGELAPRRGAGGLVTGLLGALQEAGGLWVAAAMSEGDREMAARSDGGRIDMRSFGSSYRVRYLDVPPDVYDDYYNRISNGVLWFAHHYLWDTVRSPSFGDDVHEAWSHYVEVNRRFAEALAEEGDRSGAEPAYLIQDYQLALVPRFLRELRPQALIAHFSHTSIAGATYVRMLPTEIHDQLLQGKIPLVACFETDFHRTIPDRNRYYGIPYEWAEKVLVKRYGFHGASHRYIAQRAAELLGPGLRIISCHLGGSSSLCAIRNGQSVATSMGFSAQSGLSQNNRVGDFDCFALPMLMRHTGKSLEEVLSILANQGGLLGLSGVGGDMRDIDQAAAAGNPRAKLALEVYVAEVRHYLGAYLVELGGADAIVFTGGIGENQASLRAAVCRDLEQLGIVLDPAANQSAKGEAKVHAPQSRVQVWLIPTNEELIVARQTAELLSEG